MGKSIEKLLAYIDTQIILGRLKTEDFPEALAGRTRTIAKRLSGFRTKVSAETEEEFIAKEFREISIDRIGLDSAISEILKLRIEEIRRCLRAKAPLAVIFLCGSALEGILLGVACAKPKDFNQCSASPKDAAGKTKPFHEWTLSEFISVARSLDLVGEDVKKFSHALRDFRNYIHPYQQLSAAFDPDEHTARICWQVLQAAIAQLSN